MPPNHTIVGPLRSWVNVPHHLASSTPTTPRLASLVSGPLPSSLKKGLRATKKSVSFLRSPSPPYISNSTRPCIVRPGESSPRKSSHLLEGTTTFIPNRLDLTNVSPTRQSSFFAALEAARNLIDNPPSSFSHPPKAVQSRSPPCIPQSPLPVAQSPLPVAQSPSPSVAQSPSPSPVVHRSQSSSHPLQSDFFAALRAVQDLIDNPPPPLSASSIVVPRSESPVVFRSTVSAPKVASPIVASPIVASPIVASLVIASPVVVARAHTPQRHIRKVFIPAPRPIVPVPLVPTDPPKDLLLTASLGDDWVASRLAPKPEFVSRDEDHKGRMRVLKWAADLPTPDLNIQPAPTKLHELPISPLSSSFFRSSIGAPSPSSTPPPRPLALSSSQGSFACSSISRFGSPCTPERPSGFLDWWFDSLSPLAIDNTTSIPRFLENPSPVPSSLFRPSLGAPEDSPLSARSTSWPPFPDPTSPCSHSPSPFAQERRLRPSVAGPDFSPPRGPRHVDMLASPSSQPRYAHSAPISHMSPVPSNHSWKSVAGFVGIAAGAFTLGCLAARYLF